MSKFTAPQLKALKSAVDTGNAWNAWGNVYRTSTNRMMQTLCAQGLLTHDGRPTDKTADALGVRIAYGSVKVGAAVISAQAETLYETTIPGTPGRVTRGGIDITDKLINTTGKTIPPGTYKVGVCKVEQVCGRIERTIDIGKALEHPRYDMMLGRCKGGDVEAGKAFLANSARQLSVSSERTQKRIDLDSVDTGKAHTIEYAFGKPDGDPRELEFKPFGIARLEVISWDEATPCGDDAVSQGMLTRWLPPHDPAAPVKAFPFGFAPTILFPMRNGIRKIVIRRKAK